MNINNFIYLVETNKSFDDAVVSVLKAVDQKGWALFNVYDVKERLATKGFEHEKIKIIEICSAKHASNFLNKNKLISLCMPCKINVLEKEGKIIIAGMNPRIISEFFPEVSSDEVAEVEADIRNIIDNANK